MFKVNNKETRATSMTSKPCSSVSVINFEKVNADWGRFDVAMTTHTP